MKKPDYNVIVPRIDKSGPSMLSYDIAEKMQDDGYVVNYYYLSEGGSAKNIPFKCNKIKKISLIDLFQISGIVHSHALRPDLINALLSLNPKNTTATTIPSYFYRDVIFDYPKWKAILAWAIWKFAVQKIEIRVCISSRMKRYYEKLMPKTEFKIGNNFRLDRSSILNESHVVNIAKQWAEHQRKKGSVVLVFAAGFRPRKNLLRLMKEIECHRDISLLIIGDGPEKNIVLEQLKEDNATGQFLYIGMVNSPREFFEMCDFLVLPSFAEGVPNVVLEAASVGTLSILSKIGIHCDLEKQGLAITFNHHDFSDFYEKVSFARQINYELNKEKIIKIWKKNYSGDLTMKVYRDAFERACSV